MLILGIETIPLDQDTLTRRVGWDITLSLKYQISIERYELPLTAFTRFVLNFKCCWHTVSISKFSSFGSHLLIRKLDPILEVGIVPCYRKLFFSVNRSFGRKLCNRGSHHPTISSDHNNMHRGKQIISPDYKIPICFRTSKFFGKPIRIKIIYQEYFQFDLLVFQDC